MTYLLTWVCYGTWLPGRQGAVSRKLATYGAPLPEASFRAEREAAKRMTQQPYLLDEKRRRIVLGAVLKVCSFRDWALFAAHVRSNHVHVVIKAECKPESVVNVLKSYSSRALNLQGLDVHGRMRWARHASTRYLWTEDNTKSAIHYVLHDQGNPLEVYEACPFLKQRVPPS